MTELTSFALADGQQVTVETPVAPGLAPAGLRSGAIQAERALREALEPVTAAAAEVVGKFRELPGQPAEIEIAFGVKLDATFGAVITTTAVGAHLDVTLRWSSAADPPASQQAGA